MKINTNFNKEVWIDYDETTKIKLKPFPFSNHKTVEVMDMVFAQFMECLVDWKGLTDEKGKEFKCTEENKKFVYDYVADLRDFVIEKSRLVGQTLEDTIKNS